MEKEIEDEKFLFSQLPENKLPTKELDIKAHTNSILLIFKTNNAKGKGITAKK